MYSSCIYCSAALGANEALEAFPVGKRVAFDGEKGRLWAVCPKCGRWNLAPIEERWEAVEEAERAFRDVRLRAQSENIGLAKLPDGTRLIRVGAALQGELAAWRYGDQLVKRRRQFLIASSAVVGAGLVVAGGIAWATASAGMFSFFGNAGNLINHLQRRRVFDYVPADRSPTGKAMPVRRWHLSMARLLPGGEEGTLSLEIPNAKYKTPPVGAMGRFKVDPDPLILPDADARRILSRGAVHLNSKGANRRRVDEALTLLADAGSADRYLQRLAADPRPMAGERRPLRGNPAALGATPLLALEMALHEEQERRALEGELSILEAAWRDAEEIASIADRLALDLGTAAG